MAEIYAGTNGPINFKTYYNGIARDPDLGPVESDYPDFDAFALMIPSSVGAQAYLDTDPLPEIYKAGDYLNLTITSLPVSPPMSIKVEILEINSSRTNVIIIVRDLQNSTWPSMASLDLAASITNLPVPHMPLVTISYEDSAVKTPLIVNNTDVDAGSFYVFVPTNITNSYKYFYLDITYTINEVVFSERKHYSVVRPYANVSDIVEYSGYGVDTVDSNYKTYDEVMAAERYARFKINSFTGQKFDYVSKTLSVLGDGADVLLLPERVESISLVWENDVLIYNAASSENQVTLKVTDTNHAIAIDKGAGLEVFESYPYQADRPNAGYFNNGSKYTVKGMFGYKNVPIEIYDCTIRLANDFFHQDTVWKEKYVKSMQTGDWSVDISPAAYTGTGNSAVDRMLEPFVANRMVVI